MTKRNALVAIVFMAVFHGSNAQLTQLELTSGPKKTGFTSLSFRYLTPENKFTIATLAFFQKFHQEEDIMFDEAGVQSTLYWNFYQSISIGAGLYYNSETGFSQRLSLLYAIRLPNFVFTAIPTIVHAEKTGSINGEMFLQMQLTRPLNYDWELLLSAQMLTNWDQFSHHTRSFQQVRAGFAKLDTMFGLAIDFDQYGDAPTIRTSVGVFVRKTFQNN